MTQIDWLAPIQYAGRMNRYRIATLVLPVVVALGTIVALAVIRSRLPDPMAIHYGPGGVADGFASPTAFFIAASIAIAAVTALLLWLPAYGGRQVLAVRMLSGAPLGLTVLFCAIAVAMVIPQLGTAAAADNELDAAVLLVPLVLSALAWGLGGLIAGSPADPPTVADRPAPSTGTSMVWRGVATPSPVVLVIAASSVVITAALAIVVGPALLVVAGLVGIAMLTMMRFRVVIGRAGVVIAGSPVGLPRFTVPLDQIVSVGTTEIRPGQWGGWGLRVRRNRTGIITRGGEGLRIERSDGAELVVTVDDAAAGAAVLNSFLGRPAQ